MPRSLRYEGMHQVRLLNPIRFAASKEIFFAPALNEAGYTKIEARDGVGRRFESGWEKAA